MKRQVKAAVSIFAAVSVAAGMMGVTAFAEQLAAGGTADFNNGTDSLELINPNDFSGFDYTAAYVEGGAGKTSGDQAYQMQLSSFTNSGTNTPGFVIPYYPFSVNNGDDSGIDTRTLEFSVKYDESCDYIRLQTYIATAPDNWNTTAMVDMVTFRDGKIYVFNNTDTGITAEPGRWYRVVVEEHFTPADTKIYINGEVFNCTLDCAYILGNRWTQLQAVTEASSTARNVTLTVDDIETYTGVYDAAAEDSVQYSVNDTVNYTQSTGSILIDGTESVDDILSAVTASGDKFIIDSIEGNNRIESGNVSDGNVVVIASPNGKVFEYIALTTSEKKLDTDLDFDNGTDSLTLVNPGNFSDYTYEAAYIEGGSGKAQGDLAYEMSLDNIPYSVANTPGFNLPYYDWGPNNGDDNGIDTRTMELSVRYDESSDYIRIQTYLCKDPEKWNDSDTAMVDFVTFRDGKIYVFNNTDTGLTAKPGEWYRIVIEEHYDSTQSKVYINGQRFDWCIDEITIFGNRWTQLQAGLEASETEETRNVTLAIDDIETYTGAYTPNDNAVPAYTVNDTVEYLETTRTIFAGSDTTAAQVLDAVETRGEKMILESISSDNKIESGTVSDGNVVVVKSPDGRAFAYIYIRTDEEGKIIDQDSFGEDSYYSVTWDAPARDYSGTGTASGLFGRASGDVSYRMYTEDLPASLGCAHRYNFMANTNVCSADAFTKEFSIAAEGDMDAVKLLLRTKLNNDDGLLNYNEPIAFSKDGTITVAQDAVGIIDQSFREKQWYRIALTIHPKECTYDLYLNGEKVADMVRLVSEEDAAIYDITSIEWFNIQPIFNADGTENRSGNVYIDDTVTYYGEYINDPQNNTEITSGYEIDEANGTITVPDGTDISTFAGYMDFGDTTPVIYEDDAYETQVDEWIENGNVLVLTSANGKVFAYYTIVTSGGTEPDPDPDPEDEFRVDDAIALQLTPEQGAAPAAAKASINMHVPADEAARETVLVVAAYKDGVLQGIEYVSESVSGDRLLEAELELAETDGVTVKAMLWDGGMKPYIGAAEASYE